MRDFAFLGIVVEKYLDYLRGKDIPSPISSLMAEEVCFIRYFPEVKWFAVSGKVWAYLFTKEEFIALSESIISEYAPDKAIQMSNERRSLKWNRHRFKAVESEIIKEKESKVGFIYILYGGGYYKIGLTNDIDRRLAQISPALPFTVELVHTIKTDDMVRIEHFLHEKFADKRANGEWFSLSDDDIEWLKQLEYISCEGGELEA